jgi:hypothetical protein
MPKTSKLTGIALAPRDIQILWSVREPRYLTVELIEWLHFPQWHDHYMPWQQAKETGVTKRYMPVAQADHYFGKSHKYWLPVV